MILLRHGETALNADGRFISRTDVELNEKGRAQALALAGSPVLSECSFAYCSPAARCRQTLALAAPALAFTVLPALREIDFGTWEGLTLPEIQELDPAGLVARRADPAHFRPPDGESFADVWKRLDALVNELRARDDGDRIAIVAHRGVLSVLERRLRGLPLDDSSPVPLEPGQVRVVDPIV